MPHEKKSQVDEIIILRKILDNPSDPKTKQLLSEDETALSSVYRQLIGDSSRLLQKPSSFRYQFDTLEPKVTIHTKFRETPQLPSIPVSFEPAPAPQTSIPQMKPLPEFEPVSAPIFTKTPFQPDEIFTTEELYEVEKIEHFTSEFSEVVPTESPENQPETIMSINEPLARDRNLPEWQPVDEAPRTDSQERPMTEKGVEFQQVDTDIDSERSISAEESIPEFERIEETPPLIPEQQDKWESISPAEQSQKRSPELPTAEPSQPPIQQLTRKQIREARKAEKRKEREAKKQQKLEQKKLKMKSEKKEQETTHPTGEEQTFQIIPEAQPAPAESILEEKPQPITTAFNGMKTIDERTAELLYNSGYFTMENLNEATVDDLVRIRGIRRKLAKQIKNEVRRKITTASESEFTPIKGKISKRELRESKDDLTNWESYHTDERSQPSLPPNTCVFNHYILYKKTTKKEGKKKTTIHFFSKEKPQVGEPAPLPRGYRIAVNKKTGVPYLKKKA
jgi:hypothetical protein